MQVGAGVPSLANSSSRNQCRPGMRGTQADGLRRGEQAVEVPPPVAKTCEGCAAPCLTACPAGALTGAGYDLPRCHAFLDTPAGRDCMGQGCAVRRACPVSQGYARVPEQSAYHMGQFHR